MNTAAVFFQTEAYTTAGPKLMGRNAAGESFLRGFFRHGRRTDLWVQADRSEDGAAFEATARAAGRTEPVHVLGRGQLQKLATPGCLYYPGPDIGMSAWHRALASPRAGRGWSLCGVTHTTASAGAMDSIAALLTTPVQPWDALICTSTAVRENVHRILHAQREFLAARLGATRAVLPETPVIPLGIHAEDFDFGPDERAAARARIGADEADLVVLFVGRLSFHAKAHPLAMYQALEQAARAREDAAGRIILVECGWHANESIARAFAQAAKAACPSVRVVNLDGRNAGDRSVAWSCADVFCSLSDNIQESFGITPLEAMAAGLPVVVSDWDGYKDTVRHGIDGFRIPTALPASGLGADLARRHALGLDTYDVYCGKVSAVVAVDVLETARAFSELFASRDLRLRMGESGRRRVREHYDWSVLIPRYEALWDHLAGLRQASAPESEAPPRHPWPARMDPLAGFGGYPTTTLGLDTLVQLAGIDAASARARLEALRALSMVDFARAVMPTPDECNAVIDRLAAGPVSVRESIDGLPRQRRGVVIRGIGWMAKMGVVRVLGPEPSNASAR